MSSPLEQFEVVPFVSLSFPLLGDVVLSITNLGFYTVLSVALIVALHTVANNGHSLVPNGWSLALESLYHTLVGITREQVGPRHEQYLPFIYTVFVGVLVLNLVSNVPYGFSVTSSAAVCIGLSVTVFIGVTALAVSIHGVHFASYFVPSGTPLGLVPALVLIETISYLARAVSLGVRLWANIVAGHTLLAILSTFLLQLFGAGLLIAVLTLIPFAVFTALIGLEIAVSLIQSFVFTVLLCSYLKDAIDLH